MNTLCKQESCDTYKRRSYKVVGNPIALARPRFSRGNVWDSQKDSKFMWQLELGRQHNDEPLFSGPLLLEVVFYMSIPKQRKHPDKQAGCAHYLVPDLDNLIKYVCDCLNEVIINDDALIAEIHSQKVYDLNPRTEITVIQLTTEKKSGQKN